MTYISTLEKQVWLVNLLKEAGQKGLSLKEINELWLKQDMAYGEKISRQTFNRWKWTIPDLFGVDIACNRRGGYRYYIENPDNLENGELSGWLLDTYSTLNELSNNKELKDRILVDEIPSSRNYLTPILSAMRNDKVLEITYRRFQDNNSYTYKVEPYCIKMFGRRIYMLANIIESKKLRLFGMDRIESIIKTNESFFLPKDFSAKKFFSSFYGVVHNDKVKEERIVIRAYGSQQYYVESLPFHWSQKKIFSSKEYADFCLHLCPTFDFCMDIVRYREWIEILEPQSLRHKIHKWIENLWKMYEND